MRYIDQQSTLLNDKRREKSARDDAWRELKILCGNTRKLARSRVAAEKERISKEEDGASDEDEPEPDSQESLIRRFVEHSNMLTSVPALPGHDRNWARVPHTAVHPYYAQAIA